MVNGFDRTVTILDAANGDFIQNQALKGRLGPVGLGDTFAASGKGQVWIANGGTAGVSEFNARSNAVVRTLPGASGPIAVGDGAVWLVVQYGLFGAPGEVMRIDTSSRRPVQQIKVGEADAIAAGAGAVWVADASTGRVSRIDPRTDSITHRIPCTGRR